jgi:hypothetical protein
LSQSLSISNLSLPDCLLSVRAAEWSAVFAGNPPYIGLMGGFDNHAVTNIGAE